MRVYHEQLRVPVAWWLLGMTGAFLLAAEVLAVALLLTAKVAGGAGWAVTLGVFGGIGGGCAALLVAWGHASIAVSGGELRAGAARLPLTAAGNVTALDAAQTRALRGPRANPAAFLLLRPYLRTSVYIELTGNGQAAPYWLVGTRHPAELATAIEAARPATKAGGPHVG